MKFDDNEEPSGKMNTDVVGDFAWDDLYLKKYMSEDQGLAILNLKTHSTSEDALYKISPFMTSYSLLGIISNFIY